MLISRGGYTDDPRLRLESCRDNFFLSWVTGCHGLKETVVQLQCDGTERRFYDQRIKVVP